MQRIENQSANIKETPSCTDRITKTTSILSQLGLGIIGIGAGAMYVGPAQTCAATTSCGKWLADLISSKGATAVFVSGGGNFALINAYLSSKSINEFIAFERKQPTWFKRIVWGGVISAFTLSQCASAYVSTVSTSTSSWQVFVTVGSGIPNSLYSAVGTANQEIPTVYLYISDFYRKLHNGLFDLCFKPSAEELNFRERELFYRRQHKDLLHQLNRHWKYVKSHPRETNANFSLSPLAWLMASNTDDSKTNYIRSGVSVAKISASLAANALISVPFMMNNYYTINAIINEPITSSCLTAFFSYSFLYSNMQLLSSFIQGIINILDRIITGKPIDSLVYQLHPNMTVIAVGLICAFASLSYALMNVVFEMEFPMTNKTREGFRYAADIGIIVYHIAGMYYLYDLMHATFTRNKQDQLLCKIQSELEHLNNMRPDEYRQFVENNTTEDNAELGIARYRPNIPTLSDCEAGEGPVRVATAPSKQQRKFCLFWDCSKKDSGATPTESTHLLPKPPQ